MKKLGVLWSIILLLSAGGAWASVIDAPHNEENGVKCSNCHSYSLWWRYSPTTQNTDPTHSGIVDAVCMTCHGLNAIGTDPKVTSHSPTGMGTANHQNWGEGCIACHNPHYQDQLNWATSPTKPYLVTGEIAGDAVYDTTSGLTTISYVNATNNAHWPAEGTESHPADWANKSVGNPDRGLVLVHDTAATANSFLIVSATNFQIVVKGRLDYSAIDPKNTSTSKTFGLIYGQLIRDSIKGKAVQFFDPNGGFIDVDFDLSDPDPAKRDAPTGICQVCHVAATHYNSAGELPGVTDSHSGRNSSNCVSCHAHNEGFKGGGSHDNTDFGWGVGNCATCHNANSEIINIVSDLHGGACGICHLSAQGAGPLRDGDSAKGVDGSAIGAKRVSTCIDCHITKLSLTSKGIHHISKNDFAVAGDCTKCHKSGTGTLAANHATRVKADDGCSSCHTLTAGTTAGVTVNSNDPKVHDACITCHKIDGTLKAASGKASSMPPGGGNCTACHGLYFQTHTHSHALKSVSICLNCHIAPDAPFMTATAHEDGCVTCHDAITGLLSGSAKGKAADSDCQACHIGYFDGHTRRHTMATVDLCISCHDNDGNQAIHHAATIAPFVAAGEVHAKDGCQTCHSPETGALIGSAEGMKGVAGVSCKSCHDTYFDGHSKNHSALVMRNTVTTDQVTNCSSCHVANSAPFVDTEAGEAHNELGCQTCHNAADGSLIGSAVAAGGECINCHSAYVAGHDHAHNVAEQGSDLSQNPAQRCNECHAISSWTAIYTLHNGICSTCHGASRTTGNPDKPLERVKDVIAAKGNPTSCLACHWTKNTPATHGHNIGWNQDPEGDKKSCGVSSCHNAAVETEVVSIVHKNDCSLCHVDPRNGDYARLAGDDGSSLNQDVDTLASCTDCHNPSTYPTSTIHHSSVLADNGNCSTCHSGATYGGNHTALVAVDPNCSTASCHQGAEGVATGITVNPLNKKIHGACTSCHKTNGDLKALADLSGSLLVTAMPNGGDGYKNGGGTCTACHGAYFPKHANASHTTRVIDSANCNKCHATIDIAGTSTGVPVDPDSNKVHDECYTCHNTNGSLKTAYGKASAMPAGGGSCEACHGATYFARHSNANHKTFVAETDNCNKCHPNTAGSETGVPVSATDGKAHDACTVCHNSDGSLRTKYSDKTPNMPAGGGICTVCHGDYFTNHVNANHTDRVAPSIKCVSCHNATQGTATGAPIDTTKPKVHDACATCHNLTTGDLLPGYGKAMAMLPPGGDCDFCHTSYFDKHQRPHVMSTVGLCVECHTTTGGTAPFIDAKTHVKGCVTCHSIDNGALVGSAIGKLTGASCTTCHVDYFNKHQHAHEMAAIPPLCTFCHSGSIAPFIGTVPINGKVQAHAPKGCQTCHSITTGKRFGSALNKVKGETCATCHPLYFNGHQHDHKTSMKANTVTTPSTVNCKGCHIVSMAPFIDPKVHFRGCMTCHDSTNGALTGSAANRTGVKECKTCHTTYFNAHNRHTADVHDVNQQSDDKADGTTLCNACHRRGGTSNGNPLFSPAWQGTDGVFALHKNDCTLCHNSTRTTNIGLGFVSINDVIVRGVEVGCLDCHYDRRLGHGGHKENDGTLSWVSSCNSCHGNGGMSLSAPQGEIMVVHSNSNCAKCHLNGGAGAALIGSAVSATGKPKPHPCTECHTAGFNGHSHASGHLVVMVATDRVDTNGAQCIECHKRGGTSSVNPLFTNTWSGTDGILAMHKGSCVLCHSSNRTTGLSGTYTSVLDVIKRHNPTPAQPTTTPVQCLDCHADRGVSHAGHKDTDFAWAGNCNSTCHASGNIVTKVHKNKCGLCHINPNGAGDKRAGKDGSALLAAALTEQHTATCLTCHPTATYRPSFIHHDSRTAATNDCQICHKAINHSTLVITVAPCTKCHATTAGTTGGMPVDVKNARVHDSCRTCHTFKATTLEGQLVAPTGKKGVSAMGTGQCTICHTNVTTMHHNNNHSKIGECEYCHADPRNRAGGTLFQEVTPSGGIPTHLPCEECHVKPKRGVTPGINGWTASSGQMTIYAYNEGATHSTTNYSSNFTRTVANSGKHVIANTVGQINNWGICFSCHDGTTGVDKAVRVNIFHAKPTSLSSSRRSCDDSRYAPGRAASNTIGNFNFFANTFRPSSTRPGGDGDEHCKNSKSDWSGSLRYGSTNFTFSSLLVADPWSSASFSVPMFSGQPKNTFVTPSADNVKVTSAVWNGESVIVTAANSDGCQALTAVYNGTSIGFTGNGICTATFNWMVDYIPTVPTLNVLTKNPDGIPVMGYPIVDLTMLPAGHHEGDGTFVWEETCQDCHGVATDSLRAPNGDIIEGVHKDNCGKCHQGGVGGGAMIGSANGAVGKPTPYSCTVCHAAYFDGHLQGDNHIVSMRPTDLSAGQACNDCHMRGGSSSGNPLFTNTWTGVNGILAIHRQGCGECHSSTRTTKIGGAYTSIFNVIMTGTNVGCLDCHANRSEYHARHAEGDGSFAWNESCKQCHGTTSTSTEVSHKGEIIDGVHAGIGQCELCHMNATGGANLIGSALNSDLAPRPHYCTDCHTTYFNAHQRGATHDVLMRSGDSSTGTQCNWCHKIGGTGSDSPLFVNSWSDPNGIQALHQGGCGNCHTSTRTENVSAGFSSVQDVIVRGTNVGCRNCHENRVADHGLHEEGDGTFVMESECEFCHGVESTSIHASSGEIILEVHHDHCAFCHTGGIGGGKLEGSAAKASYGVKPHPCQECHTGGFAAHQRGQGANHFIEMKPTDLASGAACNDCHRRGGTGMTNNPLFKNQVDGDDGILALHQGLSAEVGGCAKCHSSTRTRNVKTGYASINALILDMDKIGATPGCLDCHTDRGVGHGNHKATDFVWDGDCNRCHSGSSIAISVHKSNCGLCHLAPVGGGPLRAGASGSALLGEASGLKRQATCLTCHPSATYPKGMIHHKSPSAATNNCGVCHTASSHANTVKEIGTTCGTCHAATVGLVAGAPVSTTDGKIHDTCKTCHTFDANLKGILVAPTNKRGVTAMPAGGTGTGDGGGICTVCHTAKSSTVHHGNAHSLIGQCEWCHADPRNLAGGTNFQRPAPAGGIPTHLPCEECHVTPKRGVSPGINGWTATAGQMTIYAFNEGGSHSTTDYRTDFSRSVAGSGGHVIGNTVGKINNWGICFSCHDGTGAAGKAQRVNIFHAKPTFPGFPTTRNTNGALGGSSGTARYAPGREVRNTMGNFDFFANTFKPDRKELSGGDENYSSDKSASVKYGSTIFAASDLVVPDPWGTTSIVIPMFGAQTANSTTTPAADNVQVTSAIWDGFNIKVTATNNSGCSALTAVYNGTNQLFVGTGTCLATFPASNVYTSSVPNINVTTSNSQGINVTGYRITDKTKTLGSHAEGDGTFIWVSNCASCHGVASTSTVAPRGEIIADIHSGECGFCHLSGVPAATLIGSAARATVGAKPHSCTVCHVGYFDSHTHGTGTKHEVSMRSTDLAAGVLCNVCHSRNGTTSTNPKFTNTWTGTDGINALHRLGCGQCHNSTRVYNVKAPYTSVKNVISTGTNVGCLDCHASRTITHAGHTSADFVWAGTCSTCHSGVDIVGVVHKNKCGTCHLNPAGAGTLRAGSDGSGILGVSSGLLRSASCLTCHPTSTYPTGGIHHDTAPAVNNNCTTCHAKNHSTSVSATSTQCLTCHHGAVGTTTGMPVNTAEGTVHDACRTCHTFDLNLRGKLISPTNKRGVTAMPAGGGVCTVCHTSTKTMHHNNAHALIGECEYCHSDPRVNANADGTNFKENAPGGVIPLHLPCEECHVTPKRGATVNGWTANSGQMTIYAFNEGGSHSTTNYSTDFARSVANGGGHVVGNTVGKINNWGICFSCHDGSGAPGKASRVSIFHAKPTQINCGSVRYAPGRQDRNTVGNFNFFASSFRPSSTGDHGSCNNESDKTSTTNYGSTIFTFTALSNVPDPWSTAKFTVPMFANQAINTTTTPVADKVAVTSATWNGTNLVVTATNTSGCAALTAVYNGNSKTFTGIATCTATFGTGVVYTSYVPKLNVTTSNPEGIGVTGYRITTP